ncbi:CopG family transcriptional regulator [Halorientalis sp. IM1011]|uniref:ribbon-helix-helix domain-containing protein n=1 Tax=Halorientalis sp. IM1011 TaxID=1932360 RepID=UPI00097CC6D8|nr:ribbon-helix-helix domain-containing protein [Halorientalis sp. IM1011]AQL41733.1 CopG family transcriptional regulator [Halorientalis sp. IM1011]
MSETDSGGNDDPETTTLTLRVTEQFLKDVDAAWKEEGYTSRSEFLRHAIRDAVEHPGASRAMLADIAASEYAMRKGEGETYGRDEVVAMIDDDE